MQHIPAFRFHAYRDSEAPGVRRAALGVEPAYNDDELPAALEWASIAEWGAMYVRTRSLDTFTAFEHTAEQLGFRLEHVYRGGATWRFRVERIAHWADGLEQLALPGQLAQSRLF